MRYVAAAITQFLSYLTTLAAVAHFTQPGADTRAWLLTVVIALAGEAMLFGFKECLFQSGIPMKAVGSIGVVIDGIINTGGTFVIAVGILTFGPVALILGVAEIDLADPDALLAASLAISAVFGFGLAILPHILWREWGKRGRAAQRAA